MKAKSAIPWVFRHNKNIKTKASCIVLNIQFANSKRTITDRYLKRGKLVHKKCAIVSVKTVRIPKKLLDCQYRETCK